MDRPAVGWVLAAAALGLAAAGARPYAGSWNDGSRLAAVESLVDRGTLAIDDSIFVTPPQRQIDAGRPPYPPDRPDLLTFGTMDKLFIDGRYHSDKPPVPSLLMAAAYRGLMRVGLPSPADRPDVFCWTMTVLTSGLGYAVAVGCLWVLGRRVGLSPGWRLLWLGGFALATYAPTYTRHVNMHAVQLGAVAAISLLLTHPLRTPHSAVLGALAGFAFTLDYGTGPPLVVAVGGVVWWRARRPGPVLVYALAAAPWAAAAVGLNLAVGGGWKPPNMYPEYFDFPGSPFTAANLTGTAHHRPIDQVLYAVGMLLGKHGFLTHNLPLLLAAAAGWRVVRPTGKMPVPRAPIAGLVGLLGWCGAGWLAYAALSNNMGGACCSVRWFVPFLAPGFWLLAVLLRDRPECRPAFAALAGWGLVLAGLMWWRGPWTARMVPLLWPVVGLALLTWGVVGRRSTAEGAERESPGPKSRATRVSGLVSSSRRALRPPR